MPYAKNAVGQPHFHRCIFNKSSNSGSYGKLIGGLRSGFGAVSALISAPSVGAEISALITICSHADAGFSVSLVDT
jgi:hypothetical protein